MTSWGWDKGGTTVMKKSRTKQTARIPRSCSETLPPASKQPIAEMLVDVRRSLRELVVCKGLEVFAQLLEEDRTALCGPRWGQGNSQSDPRDVRQLGAHPAVPGAQAAQRRGASSAEQASLGQGRDEPRMGTSDRRRSSRQAAGSVGSARRAVPERCEIDPRGTR